MKDGKICPSCKQKNAYSINSATELKFFKTDYYVCDACKLKITPEHYVRATNEILSKPAITMEQFSFAFMYTDELMSLLVELTRTRRKSSDRAVFVQKMKDYGLGNEYVLKQNPASYFEGFLKIAWKACQQDIDSYLGVIEKSLAMAGHIYSMGYLSQITFLTHRSVPEEDRLLYECWKICYQELKKIDTTWDGRIGMRRIGENYCKDHIIKFGPRDVLAFMDLENTGFRKHEI